MPELSDRKKKILGLVVEQYIKTGEPVGSKNLISNGGLSVSSATVRNEMSELISMGLLEQPHTSAGRIPSQPGYRYYLDNLMPQREVDALTKKIIDAGLSVESGDPERLVIKAGKILADISKCACVSTTPSGSSMLIRQIELVPVGRHTAMLLLLTSGGLLKSRLCRLDVEITSEILDEFNNIARYGLIGKRTNEIGTAQMQTLAASLDGDYFTMLPLLASVCELAAAVSDSNINFDGSQNLFIHKDYTENSAASLLEFLTHKEPVLHLIDDTKDSFSVTIGRENMFNQLTDSSVIISKYKVNGFESGGIGLIGPTRMDYEQLIPSIRYLARSVGELITKALED